MPEYFVNRRDWLVGPIDEPQFQLMVRQRWFRHGDMMRIGEDGPWRPAEVLVAPHAFGEDEPDDEEPRKATRETRSTSQVAPPQPTGNTAEAVPSWFRRKKSTSKPQPQRDRDDALVPIDDGTESRDSAAESSSGIEWTAPVLSGPASPADGEIRFQTAEIELPDDHAPSLPDQPFRDTSETRSDIRVVQHASDDEEFEVYRAPPAKRRQSAPPKARSRSVDGEECSVDLPIEAPIRRVSRRVERSEDHELDDRFDSSEDSTPRSKKSETSRSSTRKLETKPKRKPEPVQPPAAAPVRTDTAPSDKLPSTFELAVPNARENSHPKTPRPNQDLDYFAGESRSRPNDDEPAIKTADSDPKTKGDVGRGSSASELDFKHLAALAADDPRVSNSELPTYQAPVEVMTPEERQLRLVAFSGRFQDAFSRLMLVMGVHACLISVVTNGLLLLAFKRLFLLAMEVFIPFGQGSGEALEEADLAFCGTGMAMTIALPFLPLSYLVKVSGRVWEYLGSLGVALIAAAVISGVNRITGAVLVIGLLGLPALLTGIFAGMVAQLADDPALRKHSILLATLSGLTTGMVAFAAPSFGITNDLSSFPPVLSVSSPHGYGALLVYGLQLTAPYLMMHRLAQRLFDTPTVEMVEQHFLFHGLLSVGVLFVFGMAHLGSMTNWFAIPTVLASLTMIVAVGFNLWSLATHFIPMLDRLRRD